MPVVFCPGRGPGPLGRHLSRVFTDESPKVRGSLSLKCLLTLDRPPLFTTPFSISSQSSCLLWTPYQGGNSSHQSHVEISSLVKLFFPFFCSWFSTTILYPPPVRSVSGSGLLRTVPGPCRPDPVKSHVLSLSLPVDPFSSSISVVVCPELSVTLGPRRDFLCPR